MTDPPGSDRLQQGVTTAAGTGDDSDSGASGEVSQPTGRAGGRNA